MKKFTLKRFFALLPLPAALVLRFFAQRDAQAVERIFSRGIYPAVAAPVSRLMGLAPFPVVEILAVSALLVLLYSLVRGKFFRVFALSGCIAAILIGGWGLNYFRLPVEDTFGLVVQPSTAAELATLCETLVADVNAYHTAPPEDILARVPDAMQRAAEGRPIPDGRYAPPKKALSSPVLTRFLIEGITSPFTAEALVNGEIPALSLPFVGCHEAAHIRGFAREEDANFVAYLACHASDDPYFRYSGAVTALIYAFRDLRAADPEAYGQVRARLSEAIVAELAAYDAFWAPYRNTTTGEIGNAVNDTYLQAVSSGKQSVKSYGRLVDLLLALQRKEVPA